MKVAILARGLARPGGAGRIITGYLGSLPAAAPDWDFAAVTDARLPAEAAAENLSEVRLPKANAAVFDHILVPRAVRQVRADVLLALKNSVPARLECPAVCVFLDLAYFALPESYRLLDNIYMRAMLRRSGRRAARIAAISRWTREDVRRFLGDEAYAKTQVIYPGLEEGFRRLSEDEKAEARRRIGGLPERFALYAGNISPRKNLIRLLEALGTLDDGIALVLTGHRRWKTGDFGISLERARRKREIVVLGSVDAEILIALYNLAEFSVYPSLYEGFGFPVIESMACGTPVAASDATSVGEVAGDAALTFDPHDTGSMAEALARLARDETLRAELTVKGLNRAQQFTWPRAASEMVQLLGEAI